MEGGVNGRKKKQGEKVSGILFKLQVPSRLPAKKTDGFAMPPPPAFLDFFPSQTRGMLR